MYITWKTFLKKVEEIYNVYVDYEDEFFICPECGEPVYEEDSEGTSCPCCGYELL